MTTLLFTIFGKSGIELPNKWGTQLPKEVIALIAAFFLLWVVGCYLYEVGSSWLSKLFLILVRLLVIAVLIMILCEPILQIREGEVHKSAVIFMIDSSESMTIVDDYEKEKDLQQIREYINQDKVKRVDLVNHFLANSKMLPKIEKKSRLHVFHFGRKFSETTWQKHVDATEDLTNIYDNFIQIVNKSMIGLESKKISGIFLLTDGQQNIKIRSWQRAAEHALQKKIPVYPVGYGTPVKKQDIIVTGVKAESITLAGDRLKFKVELRNVGYSGHQIKLFIKHGDIPLKEKSIRLGPEGEIQEVTLDCIFEADGKDKAKDYNLTIMVPKQIKEFTDKNNERFHNLRVMPKKFKVLYLEDLPRWEYRYLKNALIRDESILANMWLLSADPQFPQDKSRQADTITEIPKGKQLFEYDCIIIGDVSPDPPNSETGERLGYLNKNLLDDIVKFVKEKGGGVIFLSGPNYNPSEYWGTSFSELLPVFEDNEKNQEAKGNWTDQQRLTLTEIGKRHEIMKLIAGLKDNQDLWEERLPGFYWYYPVGKTKPASSTLALHVYHDINRGRDYQRPLMVTRLNGKGKVFFTALDSSWRWRYLNGDVYFDRFWGQVIRHISMSKLVGVGAKYYLKVDNHYVTTNEAVEVELEIRGNDGIKPAESKKVYYQVAKDKKKEMTLAYNHDTQTYKEKLLPKQSGTYKVWHSIDDSTEVSDIFEAVTPIIEFENASLNIGELKKLADATKGNVIKPYKLESILKEKFSKLTEPKRINRHLEEKPIWDHWWVFAILIIMLTMEWIFRKMARML